MGNGLRELIPDCLQAGSLPVPVICLFGLIIGFILRKQRVYIANKTKGWAPFFHGAGNLVAFMARFFREVVKPPYEGREILYQCYLVGYKSTFLIGLTAFIMGVVLTIQTRPSMAAFGAISLIPGMVSVSVVREIGPVITAIICAGKIG